MAPASWQLQRYKAVQFVQGGYESTRPRKWKLTFRIASKPSLLKITVNICAKYYRVMLKMNVPFVLKILREETLLLDCLVCAYSIKIALTFGLKLAWTKTAQLMEDNIKFAKLEKFISFNDHGHPGQTCRKS
jgi:hypothetical protein